jgi:hypothetical protein
MARPIKIFADVSQGRIFFFGTRIRPAPLGGIVVAVEHPSPVHAGKIRVTRSDLFQRDGVTPRVIFKRLLPNRVKNQAGQFLVGDLGFSTAQVIDYINDQANKKSNEIDVQNNGALVGGGTTLNFKGAIDFITVTDDVASICIDQIGVTTTGGYVGTGVTLFDFRGSGVSTVTPVTSGISTIFIESDSSSVNAANITGVITSGQIDSIDGSKITGLIDSTQLNPHITGLGGVNFTLGDSDATPAFNLSDAHSYPYNQLVGIPSTHQTTINEFQWYQQYDNPGTGSSVAGPGITTVNPGVSSNPYYYGTQLKPYQEMIWTHSLADVGAYFIGVWGGSTSYTPSNAGEVTLWEKSLVFRNTVSDGHHIDNAGTSYDSTGFDFGGGVSQSSINNNGTVLRLRYNGDSNKLELFKFMNDPVAIATAKVAQDGNPITISAALSTNATLPGITTVNYYVDQTKWKYHNSNKSLENSTHDIDQGVVYWNEPLHRGEELMFSIPGNSCHLGVWNGGTGITGSADVRNKANWSTKWQYNHNRTDWEAATASHGPTGVQMAKDIQVDNGTYAVRWDYNTNKLQLWEIDGAGDWLLSNANAALVGVTTQYIYFSRGGDNTGGGSLPSVTHRDQDFTLTSYTDATRPGPSFYDGTKVNDVWKSNRAFKNGLKLKFTVPTTAGNQYWATAFEGTEDLGNGENNSYQAGEMTWRLTNQERFTAHEDTTLNTNYTAIDGGATLALPGRNCSWRYNSDNTWDLFDEDTDEVILTGDDVLSGDVYPYLLAVNNSDDVLSDYVQYEWEWNKAAWFMEYRDWDPSDNSNTWLILSANGHALMEATANLVFSNGHYSIGSPLYNVTWGEKMRPGQEFVWTQLAVNQNGGTKNNMIIGVLDSTYSSYTCGIKFYRVGTVKEQAAQDAGFTLSAGISSATTTAGTSMRLQYEYGTNKLVCYSLNAGVRTKIAESTSALDGNPIFISMGGDSTRLPTTQGIQVYGWEVAHEPTNYYNPWQNWRIGSFPENQDLGGVGIHSTGNVLAHKQDQIWRHKDGLAPGYKMHWLTPSSATNSRFGQWKTGNATSGLTNVENVTTYWDWGWRTNTSEALFEPVGMTLNTSNSNYDGSGTPLWSDPNPGATKISIRYHGDNSLDLFDESNSEVIMTKDANCDGNPIYISFGSGGDTNNQSQLQDDFFSGGDVGIALTTATV